MILIDTGPLVAVLHAGDQDHGRCKAALRLLREPPATVWPAVGEALYLLGSSWTAQDALWEMVQEGYVRLLPLGAADVPRMRDLMRQYRDLPMDFADAALVCVAERERIREIFTLDRRHFQQYRPHRVGHFALLP